MNSDSTLARNELYSSMETGKPYAAYIKAILGQVAVTVWDNILDKPVDVILKGNPNRKEDGCVVKVWSDKENVFFRRTNKRHFDKGTLRSYEVPEEAHEVPTIEQASDEELKKIVNFKYLALLHKLSEINSIPVLFRMVSLAEDMEKSEKITRVIQARISELQVSEYPKVLEVEINPED